MAKKIDKVYCCLCGKEITNEEQHSPAPLTTDPASKCCGKCNETVVIPARLRSVALNRFD